MEEAINKVVVIANDKNSFGLVSVMKIPTSVATILTAHAKDKVSKIQKKTPLEVKYAISPVEGDGDAYESKLAVVATKEVEIDVLCATADVLTDLHRHLIQAALLPTVTGNIIDDLKPLWNGNGEEIPN